MANTGNIGPKERRKRVVGALVFLVVLIALVAFVDFKSAAPAWRLVVFVPLFLGLLNISQVQAQT